MNYIKLRNSGGVHGGFGGCRRLQENAGRTGSLRQICDKLVVKLRPSAVSFKKKGQLVAFYMKKR